MSIDDRFEELLGDLAGFYRSWLVYLGLEVGLLEWLQSAGPPGLTSWELAERAGCARGPVDGWCRAAYAHRLVASDGPDDGDARFSLEPEVAAILLDEARPEFLGGQFTFAVGASLDYGAMADFFRTGRSLTERTARYHRSVEKLNAQDTALFFEQALPQLPELAQRLATGGEVLDVACGGGGWLLAMATAHPATSLVGVEFEPGWLERARRRIDAASRGDRIRIEALHPRDLAWHDRFDLVYFQDVLHELADAPAVLAAAWRAVRPAGTLLVLDWCLPTRMAELRTPLGELIAGLQLDELYQGTSLLTRDGFGSLFGQAGLDQPRALELDAGATVFVLEKPA